MYSSVTLLKQVEKGFSFSDKDVSGIIRIEGDEIFSLNLTTLNFKFIERGNYYLFVYDKKVYPFLLENKPSVFSTVLTGFNPENGLCAGIFYEENGLPVLLAFGKDQNFKLSVSDFKSSVSAFFLAKRREAQELEQKRQKSADAEKEIAPKEFTENAPYDDEAVATYNYFENETETELSEVTPEPEFTDNSDAKKVEENVISEENALNFATINPFTAENQPFGSKTAKPAVAQRYSAENPYVNTCREDLESLFAKFPKEESLVKLFGGSDFVKIRYSGDKYYVVGLIKEKGVDKYICYGIPCEYSETPPKELDGYCVFIPLSVFDMKGDGYFIMFQDAVTGECIKKIDYEI